MWPMGLYIPSPKQREERRLTEALKSAERAVIEAAEGWRNNPSQWDGPLTFALDHLKVAREALRKFKPTAEDPLATTHKAGEQ